MKGEKEKEKLPARSEMQAFEQTRNQALFMDDSDEVDLFGIANSLLKHSRKIRIAAFLTFVLLALFFSFYWIKTSNERFIRYSVDLALQFNGVMDMKYPNGMNFNPNDMVSPDILSAVYNKAGLKSIRKSDFISAFSASFKNVYKPQTIMENPNNKDANNEGKPADEKKDDKEKLFHVINPSMVQIYMDSNQNTAAIKDWPKEMRDTVMSDIPTFWAMKFKEQYLYSNIPDPLRLIEFDKLVTLEYGNIYDTLYKNLQLFIDAMNKLEASRDLSNIISKKHKISLKEAFFYVKNDLSRQLSAWYSIPKNFGIYKDVEKRKFYLEKEYFDKTAEKEIIARNNAALESTINKIMNPKSVTSASTSFARSTTGNSVPLMRSEMPTIDDSLLERVFRSGEAGKNNQYLQDLNDRLLKGVNSYAEIEYEIALLKNDLETIKNPRGEFTKERKDTLRTEIEEQLVLIIEDYKKWVSLCVEISEDYKETEAGVQGGIYSIVSPVTSSYINPSTDKRLFKQYVILPGILVVFSFFGYCTFIVLREGYSRYKEKM
ncbi:MAG: hypothetical protein OEY64_04910 [Nitrospinota bacterium]|nr:hypothetical protein [Nitrospinota bacterium]